MRNLVKILLLFALALPLFSQAWRITPNPGAPYLSGSPLTGSGAPSNPCSPVGAIYTDSTGGAQYSCLTAGGNWTPLAGGGAGPAPNACTLNGTTSTACTHNLNTTSVVWDCYDGSNNWILPQAAVITSANVVTFTFAGNQSGSCKINGGVGPQGPAGGGGGLACTKYTTASTALTANATSQAVTLAAVAADTVINVLRIKPTVQFACAACSPSMTTLTVELGDGTTTNVFAPAFDIITTPVSNTYFFVDGGAFATTYGTYNLVATFRSTGKNLGNGSSTNLTAGSVDVTACTSVLP